MSFKRIGVVVSACLLLLAGATPLAGAAEEPPDPGLTVRKAVSQVYVVQGRNINFYIYVENVGNVPLSDLAVTDDDPQCVPGYHDGDVGSDGIMDPGEEWQYRCTMPTPLGGSEYRVATTHASATYNGATVTADGRGLTYKPATIRKAVVRYWNYADLVPYPPGVSQAFDIDLFRNGAYVGTESASPDSPLYLWALVGEWSYEEATPLPDGYQVARGSGSFTAGEFHDNTLFNYIEYDLGVRKALGGVWHAGDQITFTYRVSNAGPGSVTPAISDDQCSPLVYTSGDDGNGMVDPGEAWNYECDSTPLWDYPAPHTNTVTVVDADAPTAWVPEFGGDSVPSNNSAAATLYPFVLRKGVFVYWNGDDVAVPAEGMNALEFDATATSGAYTYPFSISEDEAAELWLPAGTWHFSEVNVPDGFVPGIDEIVFGGPADGQDWTYPNVALFDLAVEKDGPQWAQAGDEVTFTYEVTNSGPASVTPMIQDNMCDAMVLASGDDGDGLIQPDETWLFECSMTPTWDTEVVFMNTVEVWDEEGEGLQGDFIGGDTNPDNNVANNALYPFVLQKHILLYWRNGDIEVGAPGLGDVYWSDLFFEVELLRDGVAVGQVEVNQWNPALLFLAEGEWAFTEVNVPEGFEQTYSPTFTTGTEPVHRTIFNVADFDLAVEKIHSWGEVVPGKTITYKYKVTNAGPAAVTPALADDMCAPIKYRWGDADADGYVDPGETWVFKCRYEVTEEPLSRITNTVEVWDVEGAGLSGEYLGGDTNLVNNKDALTLDVGWYGCRPWCWQNAKYPRDWPDGYRPSMRVGKVFRIGWVDLDRDGKADTLKQALEYGTAGSGMNAVKRKLLKQAAAALLNQAAFGEWYPLYESESELKRDVRKAYTSGKRWKMTRLTNELRPWNGGYCPL